MKRILSIAVAGIVFASSAGAGAIENACVRSERGAGKHQLCNCIQRVADATLDRRDQSLAAQFFLEPHLSQEVRQSSRPNHEVFWQRYRDFGTAAESYCS